VAYDDYAASVDQRSARLSPETSRNYLSRARSYLAWLSSQFASDVGDPLSDPAAARIAVDKYQRWLETEKGDRGSTVNAHRTTIDDFYQQRGLGPVDVERATVPQSERRSLTSEEQERYRAAVRALAFSQDRAIATLLLRTDMYVAELVALNVEDVQLHDRYTVTVHGDRSREIPLDPDTCQAVRAWEENRSAVVRGSDTKALWVNRRGTRLSVRAVTTLVSKLAQASGIDDLSASRLRHTAIEAVAASAGLWLRPAGHRPRPYRRRHSSPEAYTRPSEADLEAAIEKLPTDH
jgi:site-specific recombinase XerD